MAGLAYSGGRVSRFEAARGFRPVDDPPPVFQIVAAAVFVFQVVSVFPEIVHQQRISALRQRIAVSGGRQNFELAAALLRFREPYPARAEVFRAGVFEGGLEPLEAAECGVDRGGQRALGAPPPSGDMARQNRLWLTCPPALFRIAVCAASGMRNGFSSSQVAERSRRSG